MPALPRGGKNGEMGKTTATMPLLRRRGRGVIQYVDPDCGNAASVYFKGRRLGVGDGEQKSGVALIMSPFGVDDDVASLKSLHYIWF